MAALLGGHVAWRDRSLRDLPHATWHGWSGEAFRGWGAYLRRAGGSQGGALYGWGGGEAGLEKGRERTCFAAWLAWY